MTRVLKASATATLVAVALLMASGTAFAANVHFKKGSPTFTDNGTTLTADGKIAGLGNEDVTITVTATGTPTTTCTNQGGNAAPGQNPADVTVSGGETIPAEELKNGNLAFSVTTLEPEQPTWEQAGCPNSNWTAEITDIDFETATITVEQGGAVVLEESYTL